jgi:hypothetical protein
MVKAARLGRGELFGVFCRFEEKRKQNSEVSSQNNGFGFLLNY